MSDLRTRLGTLRAQSGILAGAERAEGAEGAKGAKGGREAIDALRRRLERAAVGRRDQSPHGRRIDDRTLAERLGGSLIADGVIRLHERLPADARHGDFLLNDPVPEAPMVLRGAAGEGAPADCVFMDTETTGLAGGTGTLAFLLGMARFSNGALEVTQLLLTGFEGEDAMLQVARDCLRGADALVTFNGRSFDAPLLATRYRLAGCRDPFAPLNHVDLLAPTRRAFRRRWPDCRLQTAERRLLGVERIGDLPGAEAPRAWFDWVRYGHEGALRDVCRHNRLDILSLVVLPMALQRSHDDPNAVGADAGAWAAHRRRILGGGRGEEAAFEYLRDHRAALRPDGLLELARLARRRERWDLAVAIWEELAEIGEPSAMEHLAKYFEHERKDYPRALEATARLIARDPADQHHRRRDARLRARIARRQC